MERYLKPQFKTDVEQTAYRQGLAAGLKPAPTVETQQQKIANEIQQAGKNPTPPTAGTTSGTTPNTTPGTTPGTTPPTVDHHPTNPYMSWAEFQGNRSSMGIGVNQHDYDIYVRAHGGITNDSDHEKSNQQIHKNEIGGKSLEKGIPDHTHDKIVGKITIPDRPQGKTRPVIPTPTPPAIPSAGKISESKPVKGTPNKSPPIPSAGSESKPAKATPNKSQPIKTYDYPYTNVPFDPRRVPTELNDPSYSQAYKDRLQRWSLDNFTRYQNKQPLVEKPKPGAEYSDKDVKTLGSQDSKTEFERLMSKSKLVPAEDKTTEYQRAVGKQLPYYLYIDGVKQPKLYNAGGGFYDESGPKITSLGYMNTQEKGVGLDSPEKIKEQGMSRGLDLLGVIGGSLGGAASKTARGVAAVSRVRQIAQSRAGQLTTRFGARNPGSASGLVQRGSASLGRGASRIGELPMNVGDAVP
jgi:hypothetical protein